LKIDGEQEIWITNGTNFTRIKQDANQVIISWNDVNTVIVNNIKIHAFHEDGADVILDSAGIRATFEDGNINMSTSSIVTTFDSGTVTMNSSGITTNLGAGTAFAIVKLE
jgi:hypothetical protein